MRARLSNGTLAPLCAAASMAARSLSNSPVEPASVAILTAPAPVLIHQEPSVRRIEVVMTDLLQRRNEAVKIAFVVIAGCARFIANTSGRGGRPLCPSPDVENGVRSCAEVKPNAPPWAKCSTSTPEG